ncbi:MAG: hypothetical protein ACR2PG_26035 [Hyphomicrobiaceae bacterium]
MRVTFLLVFLMPASAEPQSNFSNMETSLSSSKPLPDLSGLAWIGGKTFIVVHDAKNPEELHLPRVSLMALPSSLEGVLWRSTNPIFSRRKSSDLESASRIPGTQMVLLVESTDNGSSFDRIFLAELIEDDVNIVAETAWSNFTKSFNVEATAVASTSGGEMIFIWAERNSGRTSTEIKWTRLSLNPFRIGSYAIFKVRFELPSGAYNQAGKPLYDRPLVAMDVDSEGKIYIAATLDPEGYTATPDDGPFRSIIYQIGAVKGGAIVLTENPKKIGTLDGLKVESLAIRELRGKREIFVGTDDENYGGVLRVLPAP